MTRKDGQVRWIEVRTQEVPGPEPRRLVVGRDITSEKATADALTLSENRFQRLSEAGVLGMMVSDSTGQIREANQAFLDMIQYTRADLDAGALRWDLLTPPEWTAQSSRLTAELQSTSVLRPVEKEYLRKDGTRVPVLIASVALQPPLHLTLIVDQTERRAAELALRRSESLFRAILDTSPDVISLCAADTTVLYASAAAAWLAGVPLGELVGKRLLDLPMITDREAYLREWNRCLEQPGVTVRHQFSSRRASDGELRFVESIRTNHLEDPHIRGVVTVIRDLTEQHRLEEHLRQTQKMEAIGTLAGGVAHDFNNLLTVILGYSQGLMDSLPVGGESRADVEEIHRAGERASALTRQLLAFSRKQVLDPRVLDVRTTLAEVEKLVRRLVGEHIELVTDVADPLDRVTADPGQLTQVLMNLVVNARDAMPDGGTLTLTLRNAALTSEEVAGAPEARPGRYVLLSVRDTGAGMSAETRARVFEPFFTTKKGKGTGLGLATVFGIVRQSGGLVLVDSEEGRGSTFRVYLPATQEGATPRASAPTPVGEGGTETVLVVEDEAPVRALVAEVLRRRGYQVMVAASAGEGLILCERHAGPLHLMLTDVRMPHMSGRELVDRVAPLRPDMRVLYMSGYTEDEEVARQVAEGRAAFLAKPVTPEALVRRVRELLDAAPRSE